MLPSSRHLPPLQRVSFIFKRCHGEELIRPDLVEADADAQFQGGPKVERAAEQHASFGGLRRIELVERAVAAAAAIIGRIGAESGVTEFLAAEGPMNQKPQGGRFGPLPWRQFGSPDSKKAPSRASMAAFTATAWWMIGTSPAYPSEDSSSFLNSVAAGARLMISSWRL